MPPTQPNGNGQSAIPAEISIPGLTLATYSRSTDPAFAPKSIKLQPRISSSSKRKESTPRDDVKRTKSDHGPTTSRDVSARNSQSPSLSVPIPKAVDPRIVPCSTNSPLNDINNRSNTHTPTGARSQTPVQNARSPSLPIVSSSAHAPTPVAAITAPVSATIAKNTAGPANHPVERREPPRILNAPKPDNPAEAALLAIFGKRKLPSASTSSIASLRPAGLNITAKSSEQVINTPQKDNNIRTMPTHTSSPKVLPSLPVALPPRSQHQVIPTPPRTPVTVDDSSTTMIVDPPTKIVINTPWDRVTPPPNRVIVAHPLQSSTSSYRSQIENPSPPLTPSSATPALPTASSTGKLATAISVPPSRVLGIINQSVPESTVPPIPLDAIGTLQSVSADLSMVLGKGDISNNENQLFAVAGKMSACLQAHFFPHLDAWREDAKTPRAVMGMVPRGDNMVSKAIQTITTVEPKTNDVLSKAIQTITIVEPEPKAFQPQPISFAVPQPQTIEPTPAKPNIPERPLGRPPGRDVVEKQINVQKHLSSAKVTITNQAEKVKVQVEELKRKDNVINRLQAKINQLEEENSILVLKAKPIEAPFRRPSVGILSRGIEVQKKEIEYQKRQLDIKQAHNIRLRDLLQSNGISSGLEDDIHEERRGMEDRRRSNQGLDGERGLSHGVDDERRSDCGIDDGRRSNYGIDDRRKSDHWNEQELDDGRARIMDEERGGFRDRAISESDNRGYRDRDNDRNRTTPIKAPMTPPRALSIRGHAQSPQAPMSSTRRAGGGLDKMATLMADFTELVAEKASRRLSATGPTSHEPLTDSCSPISRHAGGGDAANPTRSDAQISSPARSDRTDPKQVGTRRRSATILVQGGSRAVRAADLGKDSRSPWERSQAEGKKTIPTGPRSDRPQIPPIGPVPPPIGPRLPAKTGRKKHGGIGAYFPKDKASKITLDRYNRLG